MKSAVAKIVVFLLVTLISGAQAANAQGSLWGRVKEAPGARRVGWKVGRNWTQVFERHVCKLLILW